MPRTKLPTNGRHTSPLGTGVALMTPREIQEAARLGGQMTAEGVATLIRDVLTLMEQIEDRLSEDEDWLRVEACARFLGVTVETFRDTRLDYFRERDAMRKASKGRYLIRREAWKEYIENLPAE